MRAIGYIIVGWNVGIVWGSVFARHGHPYSAKENWLNLGMAFAAYTILVFTSNEKTSNVR